MGKVENDERRSSLDAEGMGRLSDADQQEVVDRLEAIVGRMPRLTREMFMAHRLDNMPYRDIARRTGLSVRRIERHMARAIAMLDRGLHEEPRAWWKFWRP